MQKKAKVLSVVIACVMILGAVGVTLVARQASIVTMASRPRLLQASNIIRVAAFRDAGPEFVMITDNFIPLGAMPAFATVAGLTLEEVGDKLGRPVYDDDILGEVLNADTQMVLPIDFDQINWGSLPQGLTFPVIALGSYRVGTLAIQPTTENGAEGYIVHCQMLEDVSTDASASALNFAQDPSQLKMVDSQSALLDEDGILPLDSFIAKEKLSGKGVLYASIPCMFMATEELTYVIPDADKQAWEKEL